MGIEHIRSGLESSVNPEQRVAPAVDGIETAKPAVCNERGITGNVDGGSNQAFNSRDHSENSSVIVSI